MCLKLEQNQYSTYYSYYLQVAFTDFQLEAQQTCNYDSVQIYNGPELTSLLVGKFCGENIPATFGSVSNSIRIVFSTDHSVTRRGFQMTFIAINQGIYCLLKYFKNAFHVKMSIL